MKILLLLSTMALILCAQSEELSIQEYNSVHTSNNRPSVKFQKEMEMHQIHKVDEEALAVLIKKETLEVIQSKKLILSGRKLIYKVQTRSYWLKVNAMDGSILTKVKKND